MNPIIRQDPYSLVIRYYVGTQGPTLLLDIREKETLLKLQQLFTDLADGTRSYVDMLKQPFVEAYDIEGLMLRRVPDGEERWLTLRRADRAQQHAFDWSRDAEGWRESAELLDGLLSSGMPGHQYLAEGDALVELDFMENW